MTVDRVSLGGRLRQLRKQRRWTLNDVSARTGLAVSTISKTERGEMSLTYDKFMRLAQGLGLDVNELFSPSGRSFSAGSHAITRFGDEKSYETENYVYDMLCAELRHKHMVPMHGRIKAHHIREFKEIVSHPGEEFVYVLSGVLTVHLEGREAMDLTPGDSIYFDSGLGHAYVSAGKEDAEMLVVTWQPEGIDGTP